MSEPAWVPIGPSSALDVGPEVAYQEFTTGDFAVTATTEAAAQTLVTAPAFVADGSSQYLVEYFAPSSQAPPVANGALNAWLFLDGVSLGVLAPQGGPSATVNAYIPVRATRRVTPAAGSRVFSIRCSVGPSGTGHVFAGIGGPGANVPGFIRITKVPSAVAGLAGLVPPTAIGTAFPASPVDGQEFILVDSLTAPTRAWTCKYIAAKASNKWLVIGLNSPLYAVVWAEETQTGTSPVDLATVGPAVTTPVAGDYRLSMNLRATNSGAFITTVYYKIGAAAAVPWVAGQQGAVHTFMVAQIDLFAIPAASVVKLQYAANSGTGYWSYRQIMLTPIALGG